jgi:hypothetical protein
VLLPNCTGLPTAQAAKQQVIAANIFTMRVMV